MKTLIEGTMFKAKKLDLFGGFKHIALLTQEDAAHLGLSSGERIHVQVSQSDKEGINCTVEIIEHSAFDEIITLKEGEVGLSEEVFSRLSFSKNHKVSVSYAPQVTSLDYIHKRYQTKKPYTSEELEEIFRDIEESNYSESELGYFIVSCSVYPLSLRELTDLVKLAVVEGNEFDFRSERRQVILFDSSEKVPGDIAGLAALPIAACAGVCVPYVGYTFTSIQAQLSDVLLGSDDFNRTVNETNSAVIYGREAGICATLDDLRCLDSLPHDPFQVISLISRAIAIGAHTVVYEVIYGKGSQFRSKEQTKEHVGMVRLLAKVFKLELEIVLTDINEINAQAFGMMLEAKELLKILDNTPYQNQSQRERATRLAGILLEKGKVVKSGLGQMLAENFIESEKALRKFEEIIDKQGTLDHPVEKVIETPVKTSIEGLVSLTQFEDLNLLLRALGYPYDREAGVKLLSKRGSTVKKGDLLLELHSSSKMKVDFAKNQLKTHSPFYIG